MTVQCPAPDPSLGVDLRLADYLDCQSLALGENGFQALTGGPVVTALLSGLVTIFVALIGYRMILGSLPSVRDGIGWALRLGIVLALVTSWPAFQTLVYRVVTDGPQELAAVILPAAGLSPDNMDARIQDAYDAMRLGASSAAPPQSEPQRASSYNADRANAASTLMPLTGSSVSALPQTASLFVVSTTGLNVALRLVVGILVAIGPLAILCLLFAGTLSMFDGWLRALVGAAIGLVATSTTTAVELVSVESELVHIRAVQAGADSLGSIDPQALVTIVLVFAVVALVALYSGLRVASAFRLPMSRFGAGFGAEASGWGRQSVDAPQVVHMAGGTTMAQGRARSAAVADALNAASYREQETLAGNAGEGGSSRRLTMRQERGVSVASTTAPLGVAGRRSTGRRTRSARRRDVST